MELLYLNKRKVDINTYTYDSLIMQYEQTQHKLS